MKKSIEKLSLLLCLFVVTGFLFVACDDDDDDQNTLPTAPMLDLPENSVLNQGLSATMTWNPCTDADGNSISYDVYLGTETDPVTLVSADQPDTSFVANGLLDNVTYYWKVVAKDGKGGSVPSEVWSFSTNAFVGTWISDDMSVSEGVTVKQKYVFNADGTGTLESVQTGGGGGTYNFVVSWTIVGDQLTLVLTGDMFAEDTLTIAISEDGNSIDISGSEVTPGVVSTITRLTE